MMAVKIAPPAKPMMKFTQSKLNLPSFTMLSPLSLR
jgi:hypothetical protein